MLYTQINTPAFEEKTQCYINTSNIFKIFIIFKENFLKQLTRCGKSDPREHLLVKKIIIETLEQGVKYVQSLQ